MRVRAQLSGPARPFGGSARRVALPANPNHAAWCLRAAGYRPGPGHNQFYATPPLEAASVSDSMERRMVDPRRRQPAAAAVVSVHSGQAGGFARDAAPTAPSPPRGRQEDHTFLQVLQAR
jgi:hypothetical protein